jgi:hypothetical protein
LTHDEALSVVAVWLLIVGAVWGAFGAYIRSQLRLEAEVPGTNADAVNAAVGK